MSEGERQDVEVKIEKNSEEETEPAVLPHTELMKKVQGMLSSLINIDPLLRDLPREITLDEVNSQIALEYGQAMTVNVCREDGEVLSIVVVQDATLMDLKRALKRHITLRQERKHGKLQLSWKYIWKRYWLYYAGQKLTEDRRKLKEYGFKHKDELTFIKRLKRDIGLN